MHSRIWWGILLVAVGVFLVLDNTGVWDLGDVLDRWWPSLLIVLGFALLVRRRHVPVRPVAPRPEDLPSTWEPGPRGGDDELRTSSFMGDLTQRVSSRAFRGGAVSNVFGDTFIDCSTATMADGVHTLVVNGVFGDLHVRMPKGAFCSVKASTLLGSVNLFGEKRGGIASSVSYETPGFAEAHDKIRIRLSAVAGDVEVDQ